MPEPNRGGYLRRGVQSQRQKNGCVLLHVLPVWSHALFFSGNNERNLLFADEIVALKRLKMEKEKEGFPITSLREINTILKAQHPNIVTVRVRERGC